MIKYFKLSSEAIRKAIDLAGNNNVEIEKCLKLAIDQPKLLLPEYIIFNKIKELQIAKNNIVNCLLGIYHFKHTKDYEEAKNYFNKGIKVDVHDFLCFYYIIKIECRSKDPCDFPFIKMLMDHYPNFLKDIERVKILSQILIYCVYYQKDQAKLLYFLQKFMDQPFDNAFKYRHLNSIWPLWKLQNYNGLQFIEDLSNIVKQLMFTNNSDEYHKTSENFFKMIYEGKNIKYTDDIRIEMPKYESSNNSM